MPTVILYFGSFNPVHNGHIALARTVAALYRAQVWFVLSPQSPFKRNDGLWPEGTRAYLLEQALRPLAELKFCDVELHLPKPSYTIDTLRHLQGRYPHVRFMILMGEDNLYGLPAWKESEEILDRYPILVYPRQSKEKTVPGQDRLLVPERSGDKITFLENLPLLDISSTGIRQRLAKGKDISNLVPWQVSELDSLPLS